MIGYVLLIILMAGAWTLLGFGAKRDTEWQVIVGLIFGLITTVLFMVATLNMASRHSDAVIFQEEREYHQQMVTAMTIGAPLSLPAISRIIISAKNDNKRIERNRKYCNSLWFGFMYNKEIAEVEPIDIPKIKYKITIEENASEE